MTAALPFVLRRRPPSAAKANWPESFIENDVTEARAEGTGAGCSVRVTGSKEKLCATTAELREEKKRKTAAIVLNTISTPYGKWVFLVCLPRNNLDQMDRKTCDREGSPRQQEPHYVGGNCRVSITNW
jgi:hypothetical protein